MTFETEILAVLAVNFLLWLVMAVGRPIVVPVDRIPHFGFLAPLGLNFLMFVLVTRSVMADERSRERVLRHEFSHYRQVVRFTPLVLAALHLVDIAWLIARNRAFRGLYRDLWIERDADRAIRPGRAKYWLADLGRGGRGGTITCEELEGPA